MPEEMATACLRPAASAINSSKRTWRGPMLRRPDLRTSVTAWISALVISGLESGISPDMLHPM